MMASRWNIVLILMISLKVSCLPTDALWLETSSFQTNGTTDDTHIFKRNQVAFSCPEMCVCEGKDSDIKINCNDHKLTQFPTNLHHLVSHLDIVGNNLHYLNYSISLQTLVSLNVSKNSLVGLDKLWLSSLKNLKVLDLSKNALISNSIKNSVFSSSLLHLDLSHNRLNVITSSMFQQGVALTILDLCCNEIESISYNSFWSQTSLEQLDLSGNKLLDIQHEWFKSLKHLKILRLKQNNFKLLRNLVFWPLQNLNLLDISENQITSIGLLSFKGLTNLQFLNLSMNSVGYISEGVFRSLESVKVLDISQNSFKSTDKIFIHAPNLVTLYMKNLSCFQSLTASSLIGLKSLENLDISGSKNFSEINLNAFMHTRNLKHLDLSNSNLSNLAMGVFNDLMNIETIDLKRNPWKCDCYVYWILIWLNEHIQAHLLSPSEILCDAPQNLQGQVFLDALDHNMVCTNASIYHYTKNAKFRVGSTAFLKCQVKGQPLPTLTWLTPQKLRFHWSVSDNGTEKTEVVASDRMRMSSRESAFNHKDTKRFYLMSNGNLVIKNIERGDGGFYKCVASNPLGSHAIYIRLTLDYEFLNHIKIVSILVGLAASFGFLLITLIAVLIQMILKHFNVKCPCRSGNISPRTQHIKKILINMEQYKKHQLDRLRDNYNGQVQRIKDNCMQQMERLRESYSSQAERLRDIRDYGTLQIDRIRENYYFQVQRVRDYSNSQIIRLRENYVFQRNRIRKFSAHHLYKLRENYKLQQQHFNKILENLTIENCRNVCQRTDSVVFEPDITFDNVLVPKICLQQFSKVTCDSNDNSSQISAYFTPDEAGSELSVHGSDEECCENISKSIINHEEILDALAEITDAAESSKSNIPSDTGLQPNVVLYCDLNKNESSDSNETIV